MSIFYCSPTGSPSLLLRPLRLFPSPISSAAPLPRTVLEAPRPACPRDRLVPRGLSRAAALIKVGVAKASLVLLRILVDPQHIPTELPGPLSADFGPPPHKLVIHQKKSFYQLAPPPGGRRLSARDRTDPQSHSLCWGSVRIPSRTSNALATQQLVSCWRR